MTPTLRPSLINGRFGDPALYVEVAHERDAVLFDMGDLSALSARDLLRVRAIGVSHMHIDHMIGFDALLRVNIGREARIEIVGPEGLGACIGHKLAGYSWDLTHRYAADLVFDVVELVSSDAVRRQRFRFLNRFQREAVADAEKVTEPIITAPGYGITASILEHHGPCLAFAITEPVHINVWRNRVEALGLSVGAWLKPLKEAVRNQAPDTTQILTPGGERSLGELRHLVSIEPGQKIGYVTDVRDTADNRAAISYLCCDADTLFIDASFAAADHARAYDRAHLTTTAAGEIAAACRARRVEPFHFSAKYEKEEAALIAEVDAAFRGESRANSA